MPNGVERGGGDYAAHASFLYEPDERSVGVRYIKSSRAIAGLEEEAEEEASIAVYTSSAQPVEEDVSDDETDDKEDVGMEESGYGGRSRPY